MKNRNDHLTRVVVDWAGLRLPALRVFLAALVAALPFVATAGQTAPAPQREQLLNGLRTLLVHRQGDSNVLLKLRIHSGAAFDLAGKEGLMALLGDALFDAEAREFVREDLGGRLEIATTYDAIDVTISGRAVDFERFVDLLRNAILNTQLTPDIVGKLRERRITAVREVSPSPGALADRIVAARLFGTHPYGRTVEGTPESLARAQRADLMVVRERYLNPNNATLVIVGGIEPRRAMRLLRQNLGGWTKSDRIIPSTFRQPEVADPRTLVVNSPGSTEVEVRLAVRGLARSDRDAPVAQALVSLVRDRWLAALPELKEGKFFARHDARSESGIFVMGASVPSTTVAAKTLDSARKILADLASAAPGAAELDNAKRSAAATPPERAGDSESYADDLLAEHTYKTRGATRSEIAHAIRAITPAETQRVAARLFQHTPVATVAVGDAASLSIELARAGAVEVFGATTPSPSPLVTPPQPQSPVRLKRP